MKGARLSRRKFVLAAIGAVVASAGTFVIVTRRRWVDAGSASLVPAKTFIPFGSGDYRVFLRSAPNGGIVALSERCSHQGCRIVWESVDNEFHCPCHKGIFDASGNPVSGPPTRPLERFETRVEKGDLEVLM